MLRLALSGRSFAQTYRSAAAYALEFQRGAAEVVYRDEVARLVSRDRRAQPSDAPLVVDVRTRQEIADFGALGPAALNIPLDELPGALQLTDDEFAKRYAAQKPAAATPLVFSCRSGVRSETACGIATQAGFSKCVSSVRASRVRVDLDSLRRVAPTPRARAA